MKSKDDLHIKSDKTMDNELKITPEGTDELNVEVDTAINNTRNKTKPVSTDVKNKKRIDHALMKANQMSSKIRIKAHQVLAGNRKK
jgi:hypothetical protein